MRHLTMRAIGGLRRMGPILAVALSSICATAAMDAASVEKAVGPIAAGQWKIVRLAVPVAFPLPPKPRTGYVCIDPSKGDNALDVTVFHMETLFKLNCNISNGDDASQGADKHLNITLSCTPDLAKQASIELTITGDKKVAAVTTFSKQVNQPWLVYHEDASWVGPCPAKP